MIRLLQRGLPWLLGFLLVANVSALPGREPTPRATDLVAMAYALVLISRAARSGIPAIPLAASMVAVLLPLCWTFLSVVGKRDMMTVSQGARWVLAVPWAIVLAEMLRRSAKREQFLWGMVVGLFVNAGVVVAQHYDVDGPLQRIGLSNYGQTIYMIGGKLRLPGLHGAPSSSSAVMSLMVPATFYLYLRERARLWLPVTGLVVLAVTLHLTSSRSPLLISAVSAAVALVVAHRRRRAWILGALLLVVGLPSLVVVGPPGGWVRWTDETDAVANVDDRLLSNVKSLELSAQHPLGLGVVQGKQRLMEESGSRATHNAFLQASLFFGTPLAIMLLGALVFQTTRLRRGLWDGAFLAALVAVHLAGLFFFEEHLNNPTFVILVLWLLADGTWSLAQGSARQPEQARGA